MVQAAEKFTEEERLRLVLHGTSFAMYEANKDKENYIKFKNGQTDEFSETTMRDMNLLKILERLGYSIDELGTYLYKDVIAETYEKLKGASSRNDMDRCREIMSSLTDAFSGFYRYIAREWKEMGVKTFHLYIQKAIDGIEYDEVDVELAEKIFGDNPEEQNYGVQAFQIAAYAVKKYSFDNTKEYKRPLVKKLPNMPDNLKLKDNF